MVKLFLNGYEKETLDDFLCKLRESDVKAVIDVREIPLSRKNGFSKKNLESRLADEGIRYYHFPELGSPRVIREELYSTGDYLNFFIEYRKYINKNKAFVERLTEIVLGEEKSVLLCLEENYELCHRSIITDEITKINSQIMVIPT